MSLIGGHVFRFSAERGSPAHGVALVAGVTEVERVGDLRQVALHHVLVTAEAGAGQDERFVFNLVARSVRSFIANGMMRNLGNASGSQDV